VLISAYASDKNYGLGGPLTIGLSVKFVGMRCNYYAPPLEWGIKRRCASDVCLSVCLSVCMSHTSDLSKSTAERPRKFVLKLAQM